jgi:excisionase family DNA binding protein
MSEKLIYSVAEVSALTGLSRQTVTRMLEQGEMCPAWNPEAMHKRRSSIRIPRTVYGRVAARASVGKRLLLLGPPSNGM